MEFPLKNIIFIALLGSMMIPAQVTVLPLSTAPLASLAVLALVNSWNDCFTPLIFVITPAEYMVSLGIRKYAADIYTNLGLAASVSAIAPILLLYIFCQRYFVQSIASSGIKG